jgi:hypothetical protein
MFWGGSNATPLFPCALNGRREKVPQQAADSPGATRRKVSTSPKASISRSSAIKAQHV